MNNTPTILVVDDEPELRELIVLMLESNFSLAFCEAGSGQEALAKIAETQIDLIISDYNMPNGNGKELFQAVQKMAKRPGFILSTSDDKTTHKEITATPGTGYIQKPFENSELFQAVNEQLSSLKTANDLKSESPQVNDFVPLSFSTFRKFSPFEFETYIRLSENHFIKFFNSGHLFTSLDEENLKRKSIQEVYIQRQELNSLIRTLQKSAFESMIFPTEGMNHAFVMTEVVHDLVKLGLKGLMTDKELMQITEKNLKTAFAVTDRVEVLKSVLAWVHSDKVSLAKIHSTILSLFSNIMVGGARLEIPQNKAILLLSYASILHDSGLDEYTIRNEWRLSQGIRSHSAFNKNETEVLRSHLGFTHKTVDAWTYCPPEVLKMIDIHHEWPTGIGFPRGLKGNDLDPLSGIFMVAHEISSMVFEYKNREALRPALKKIEEDLKPYPHLMGPFNILVETLFR